MRSGRRHEPDRWRTEDGIPGSSPRRLHRFQPSVRSRVPLGRVVGCAVVTPEEIRAIRKQLRCTMQELASALGVEPRTVMAWEDAEQFPTRQFIEKMQDLAARGPGAIVRSGRRRTETTTPMQALTDPETWRLVRKLLAHPELRRRAQELAASYDDPET